MSRVLVYDRGESPPVCIEQLWYLKQRLPCGYRTLLVRADSAGEAVGFAVEWGVPPGDVEQVNGWGFNLSSDGVVFTILCVEEGNDESH